METTAQPHRKRTTHRTTRPRGAGILIRLSPGELQLIRRAAALKERPPATFARHAVIHAAQTLVADAEGRPARLAEFAGNVARRAAGAAVGGGHT